LLGNKLDERVSESWIKCHEEDLFSFCIFCEDEIFSQKKKLINHIHNKEHKYLALGDKIRKRCSSDQANSKCGILS
jgi:hypothetical protein